MSAKRKVIGHISREDVKIFITFFILFTLFLQWGAWREDAKFDLTRSITDRNELNIDYYKNTGDYSYYKGHYYCGKSPGESFLASSVYFPISEATNLRDYRNYSKYKVTVVLKLPSEEANEVAEYPRYLMKNSSWGVFLTKTDRLIDLKEKGTYLLSPASLDPGTRLVQLSILLFFAALPGALLVVLIYKITKFYLQEKRTIFLIVILIGIATPLFNYSTVWQSTITGTFLSFLSFYLIIYTLKNDLSKKYYFLAGLIAGISIFVLIQTLLVILPMLFIFRNKRKRLILFLAGFTLGILPLILYNTLVYETPLNSGSFGYQKDIGYCEGELKGKYCEVSGGNIFSLKRIGELAVFHFRMLVKGTFYPYSGFMFFSPVLFLAFLGNYKLMKSNLKEKYFLVFISLLVPIFSIFYVPNFTGYASYGMRYIVPLIPFLAIPLSIIVSSTDKKWFKALLYILVIISVFHTIMGLNPWFEWAHNERSFGQYYGSLYGWEPLGNPIYGYYLNQFSQFGPTSRIFEQLIRFRFPPNLRWTYPRTKIFGELFKNSFVFETLKESITPFLPFLATTLILWRKRIFN